MRGLLLTLAAAIVALALVSTGCSQPAAAPPPTAAPAAPAKAAEPAKAAPTQAAAPTKAPEPAKSAAPPAAKVDYPAKGKTITHIVPYAAGTATGDVGTRILSVLLEREVGIPIQVVNKEGATTQVGMTALMSSDPDGYIIATMSMVSSTLSYLDATRKALYTRKSFEPVAVFMDDKHVLGVKSTSPYKTAKDLLDEAKAKPRSVRVGDGGLMGSSHFSSIALQHAAGVEFRSVHFNGGGPATTALLGGHVEAVVITAGNLVNLAKSGEVRILGVINKEESRFLPDVKTLESQGYKAYQVGGEFGVLAPAGTNKEIAQFLAAAMKKVSNSAEFKEKMDAAGMERKYLGPAEFADLWIDVENRLKPILEQAQREQKEK